MSVSASVESSSASAWSASASVFSMSPSLMGSSPSELSNSTASMSPSLASVVTVVLPQPAITRNAKTESTKSNFWERDVWCMRIFSFLHAKMGTRRGRVCCCFSNPQFSKGNSPLKQKSTGRETQWIMLDSCLSTTKISRTSRTRTSARR